MGRREGQLREGGWGGAREGGERGEEGRRGGDVGSGTGSGIRSSRRRVGSVPASFRGACDAMCSEVAARCTTPKYTTSVCVCVVVGVWLSFESYGICRICTTELVRLILYY
jgi:hypothetical protein